MRALFCALLVAACASGAPPSEPKFTGAYPSDAPGLIQFEPFAAVDWRGGATPASLGFDPDNPTDADLEMLSRRNNVYSNAEVDFPVEIDRTAHGGCHRLLSADGVERIDLLALRGTARFTLGETAPTQIVERTYFGYALAPAGAGGFVMWTPACTAVSRVAGASFSLERDAGPVLLRYRDSRGQAEATMPRRWFTTILSAYAFNAAGRRYAFVQWPPDADGAVEAFCEFNYLIYLVEATLRLIDHNNYGCDV